MKLLKRKKHNQRRPLNDQGTKRGAPVVRYYSSDKGDRPAKRTERIQSESDSTKKAKFTHFLRQLPQRLVFVAIVLLLLVNTTLSSAVIKLDNENNAYRTKEAYKQGIDDVFASSLLYKSKASLSSEKFERQVIEKFPEVSEATAIVPLAGRQLQVNLSFTKPLMRLTTADNRQGIVGESGNFILIDSAESPALFENIPVLSLQKQPELEQGTQLLTSVETALLQLLISEFDGSEEYRHQIKSVLFDVEKREMQLRFSQVKYYAKLTPEREAREQVGALIATLKQLSEEKKLPKQYIDVRVEDRTFVR